MEFVKLGNLGSSGNLLQAGGTLRASYSPASPEGHLHSRHDQSIAQWSRCQLEFA